MKVMLIAENASLQAGGEAALAIHWFRELQKLRYPVWLLCHSRFRAELLAQFPNSEDSLVFVEDTWLHRSLYWVGSFLPYRVSVISTGMLIRFLVQGRQLQQANHLVRQQGIDLVHVVSPVSPLEPSRIRNVGAPVIFGPMNGGMEYPNAFAGRNSLLEKMIWRFRGPFAYFANLCIAGKRESVCLLAANQRTHKILKKWVADIRSKILIFPENGVDFKLCGGVPAKDCSHRTIHYCFVGRLVDWKGVDILLKAFSIAASRCNLPITLSIAGDGPMRQEWESMSRNLHILGQSPNEPGKVFFYGWLEPAKCAELMGKSDVFVLPSLLECGGAVVLEAMASGLPVIACDWGGPADYLDESCGVLLSTMNEQSLTEELYKAMLLMAQNSELRVSMGRAAATKARNMYGWEAKVLDMLKVYKEVLR